MSVCILVEIFFIFRQFRYANYIYKYFETINPVSNNDEFDSDRIRYRAKLSVSTEHGLVRVYCY